MEIKTILSINGKLTVHATEANGSYRTFCGLDGIPDCGAVKSTAKVTCRKCKALWLHSRRYKLTDFAAWGKCK
jgi:hypothetical protein